MCTEAAVEATKARALADSQASPCSSTGLATAWASHSAFFKERSAHRMARDVMTWTLQQGPRPTPCWDYPPQPMLLHMDPEMTDDEYLYLRVLPYSFFKSGAGAWDRHRVHLRRGLRY